MLNNLTVQELLEFEDLLKIAKEAEEARSVMKKAFSNAFGSEKSSIHVYHNTAFGEYFADAVLSKDFEWHFHDNWWNGRDWFIDCSSAEGIYKFLRGAYYAKINEASSNSFETPATHFRQFISETKAKLEKEL